MADKMFVIITARKEVPDRDAARQIYETVKTRMVDRPDIEITGHASNHFDLDEE